MKINRKLFFKIHSWIGIKLSILFFIVCFSGTLATLSHEMDWLFIPEIRAEYKGVYADKNTMLENIKKAYPNGRITYWTTPEESYLCNIVYIEVGKAWWYAFVNPYTGEVQGKADITFQRFFRDLHYFLFIPFQIGHFIVLIFAFMLFVSTVTALLFYKKWYRKLFDFKLAKGRIVFYRNLHRLIGVWSVPFCMLFSVTGIWYFMERSNLGDISNIANTQKPKIEKISIDSLSLANLSYSLDYNKAVAVAQTQIPDIIIKDILPPNNKTSPIYLTGTSDVPLVRNRANRVYVHPITYEIIGVQNAKDIGLVTWLNDIADPLHYGNLGGLITKVIWFLGGLCISILVLTGIWISLKRKVKNLQMAKHKRFGVWKFPNVIVMALVLGCMYTSLVVKYQVSFYVLLIVTIGWIALVAVTWYIFFYKLAGKPVK